jgi:CheY-like chemotaxis protein/anti-sigma regulatory factor (Ser/Thr protein kinase)
VTVQSAIARPSRILVADDEDSIRELLSRALTEKGYAVETAKDGAEALERVERQQYNLVLLDIWMPRMNGLEVLSRLHKRPSPPRVIVMTADNTPETLLHAVKEEAYQCMAKPFEMHSMTDLVERVLTSSAQAPAIEVISARPQWIQLLVPCERETVERIESFLMTIKSDLPEQVRRDVGQAFHELLLNAIEWGGRLDPNRRVYIGCVRTKRMILYRISDPGHGFRIEGLEHAAVNNPPDNVLRHVEIREQKGMRPGGFGLMLTRALVDELIYNEAHNEVIFLKYLD